jgi:hypothetical protein
MDRVTTLCDPRPHDLPTDLRSPVEIIRSAAIDVPIITCEKGGSGGSYRLTRRLTGSCGAAGPSRQEYQDDP